MTNAESIKKDIDTIDTNDKIEVQEMEEFLKSEENIKRLGEVMNSSESPELLQELESALKDLCENILELNELTNNQEQILNYFLNKFGDKYPELKGKIETKAKQNQESIQDQYTDITSIQQEIDNEVDTMLQSMPLNNLKELGIDVSLQNNKNLVGIKRGNVIKDIKKPEDINKINNENINQYFTIPANIPQENYTAITENIKQILYRHLQLHPGRRTIIGNEGYSTGMSLKSTRESDTYEANLHQQIQKLQKKSLEEQADLVIKNLPNSCDLLDLRLKTTINSKKYEQETILKNLFNKIPVEQSDKFFKTCDKNSFINELKNNYAQYRLNKNNCIKTGDKYCFLDRTNQSNFKIFKNKGIKLSENLTFDELYEHTKNFYTEMGKFGIDATIPIQDIVAFNKKREDFCINKSKYEKQYEKQVHENNNPYIDALGQGYSNAAHKSIRDEKINEISIKLEEEYARLLLLKKPRPKGRILGMSGIGVYLNFSKGNDPKKIVRDSFTEQLGDQREKFKYDLNNDRQAAFGSAMGMIGGIAGSALIATFTQNIRATSAGFTAGLRLGNGLGQELWNSGEFLYEQATGKTINDGNNKVESFGMGFKRGLGLLDQNYEDVGTLNFISGLGFDYLSTVATFGLSQKFGGFLGKLEGIKFAGGALKFGMEELILENFFVDIPMNIVQTGIETFTGIGDGIIIGNTVEGQKRRKKGQKNYKSGNLEDMLISMKEAVTQNLSFENLSQTFFNTVIYGGFLEGGGAAIKKMKGYLPSGQVSNFTERSAAASAAFLGLTNFMSSKNINFNKDGVCIDTKTNLKIEESDPRFQELCTHLNAVEATKAGVIESFETIMETQKQMVSDPENRTGLLFRLGLISPTNTPLNILKKKKELVEKKLNEAKEKGDNNKVNNLQKLLDIYTDAETKLNNSDYFDGKSKKLFEGNEKQARGNSKNMDKILSEINEQNKSTKLEELRKEITEQYKQATGEDLQLTDEQLLSILDAHEQDGELGKLKLGELRQKVKILDETITDPKVRRFLLEAGFCGRPQEIHKNINIGNQNCEITYRGNYGEMKIRNSDGTITNIDFGINGGESKYLEFFINEGGKIENYTIIEQLYKISKQMGTGGKIGFAKEGIPNLNNVLEKQVFEKIINSENFSVDSMLHHNYNKYNKRYPFEVFEKFLSFNIKLPQKLFTKNFLTQLINGNTFFEARAKVNHQGNELNKIYFHEMIGEYIDGIDLNSCNPELLSDLIIDYHFNKISYNVFLDIKELLRFQIEKGNFLSKEKLKIYRDILNIDKLSNKEKIELHKSLIGKNVAEMFENDIQKAREISKKEIADSILNHESIEQYKDEELSKKYGVNVYNFDGQPFYALAKVGKINRKNPEHAVTRSFSLVGTECTGVRGDPGNHTFLYEGLTPQQIIHVSNDDSGSGSGMHDEFGQKTDRVFRIGSPSELLSNTRSYNELIILEKGTVNTSENTSLNDIKPIAIYCYEITEETVKTAKEYGVGIALINNNKYNKNNSKNKGHNTIFEDYMYPYRYQKSTDYYYAKDGRRNELCTFEDMDKIDDMIEGRNNEEQTIDNQKENNSDYFNGKSHQFEVTEDQARSNSKNMDKILSEINKQNKSKKLEELRKEITEQYKQATGEELKLGDKQLLSILDAHEQDGILGELTMGQLRKKVKVLNETITDPKVRRFLLEAGFCGMEDQYVEIVEAQPEEVEIVEAQPEEVEIVEAQPEEVEIVEAQPEEVEIVEAQPEEVEIVEAQQRRGKEEQQRALNQNERPDRGINTERREMAEVQRNSDVVAIGDLHGEYGALKGNMEYAGLAKETNGHLERTGGNKIVVFQGDILADRGTDGLKIIQDIHQLREQARKQGGDIDIIVGNHDDFFITYLLGGEVSRFDSRPGKKVSALDIAKVNLQGMGLTELLDFVGIKRSGIEYIDDIAWSRDFYKLKGKNNEILNAMRNSQKGRLILEEICNMKLVSQVDDVLYCHTNPTNRILEYLTRGGNIQNNINLLNQKYQGYLRKALLGEGTGNITVEEFNDISDIFLNTGNRYTGLNDNYATLLRNNGINMISHGHNGGSNRYGYTNNQMEIGGVKVVDTDYSYGKKGKNGGQHSVSIVKKEGGVNYIGDNVAYANIKYPIGSEVYVKRSAGGESRAE